jgi:hypothetical protein
VRSEGNEWYDVHQSDLFIVSLLLMATFALIWSLLQGRRHLGTAGFAFVVFIAAATTLFSTILWSKFAHMFFKPAAAFQKKVAVADGSRDKLPEIPDLSSAETRSATRTSRSTWATIPLHGARHQARSTPTTELELSTQVTKRNQKCQLSSI